MKVHGQAHDRANAYETRPALTFSVGVDLAVDARVDPIGIFTGLRCCRSRNE